MAERAADDFEFAERLEELNEELETLNAEARELEERIAENVATLLESCNQMHRLEPSIRIETLGTIELEMGLMRPRSEPMMAR